MDKDFLLDVYGRCWDPEAGPFNLSVENKYLEYQIAKFFEDHFSVAEGADICNIGVGAGYWDRYLSYKLRGGSLTSVDVLADCCWALREGLENEKNPNRVTVINADVMTLAGMEGSFDIITMIGSTVRESGLGAAIVEKALSMVRPGGCLYLQTLFVDEGDCLVQAVCKRCGAAVTAHLHDTAHGFDAQYWKLEKGSGGVE